LDRFFAYFSRESTYKWKLVVIANREGGRAGEAADEATLEGVTKDHDDVCAVNGKWNGLSVESEKPGTQAASSVEFVKEHLERKKEQTGIFHLHNLYSNQPSQNPIISPIKRENRENMRWVGFEPGSTY